MFISGFTLVRNGQQFDYPFLESVQSLLSLCDEVIVNVGESDDNTWGELERLKADLPPKEGQKLTLFKSVWPLNDPEKRKGGQILAEQTNLALKRCRGDWCVYLQADEVLHEQDIECIKADLQRADGAHAVDALVFNYVHFYGAFDVVQTSRSSYRREIRAIRNRKGIWSVGDAQSFRYITGEKIPAALTKSKIYHYGWVRPQEVMKAKTGFMDTLYHPGAKADAPATGENYKYKRFVGLKSFKGTHPGLMAQRVNTRGADPDRFILSQAPLVFEPKDTLKVLSGWFEACTGIRPFEYKNYKLLTWNDVKDMSKTGERVLKQVS